MYKKVGSNSYGQIFYTITSLADVATLPKIGITTGSIATFPNHGDIKAYIFTASEDGTNGTWDEVQ